MAAARLEAAQWQHVADVSQLEIVKIKADQHQSN
jgi:hypothetical protein